MPGNSDGAEAVRASEGGQEAIGAVNEFLYRSLVRGFVKVVCLLTVVRALVEVCYEGTYPRWKRYRVFQQPTMLVWSSSLVVFSSSSEDGFLVSQPTPRVLPIC